MQIFQMVNSRAHTESHKTQTVHNLENEMFKGQIELTRLYSFDFMLKIPSNNGYFHVSCCTYNKVIFSAIYYETQLKE